MARVRPDAAIALLAGLGAFAGSAAGLLQNRPVFGLVVAVLGAALLGWGSYRQVRQAPAVRHVMSAPPPPSVIDVWNIPDPVTTFDGRADDLDTLAAMFDSGVRTVALVGLGGWEEPAGVGAGRPPPRPRAHRGGVVRRRVVS
jgi:hypothetical protein